MDSDGANRNPNTQRSIFLIKKKKKRCGYLRSFLFREPSVIMPQRSEFSSQPTCLEVLFFLASFLVPRGTGVICSMNRERENAVFKLLVFERNLVRYVFPQSH